MAGNYTNEPMLDIYVFEANQLIEQLEGILLINEKSGYFSLDSINEIFRIMHTIKGSSAMMLFNDISNLAHVVEDLFYLLREEKEIKLNCSELTDLVFESIDFIKLELEKIKSGDNADGEASNIISKLRSFIEQLRDTNNIGIPKKDPSCETNTKQYYISQSIESKMNYKYHYKADIFFEDGCEMENIRAYTIVHSLKNITDHIRHIPEDIIENDETIDQIREQGFKLYFSTNLDYEEANKYLGKSLFLKKLDLEELLDDKSFISEATLSEKEENNTFEKSISLNEKRENESNNENHGSIAQGIVSVPVSKMDKLMDLVGEMVIAEAMVTQNPDLRGLNLDNFNKAARQLRKITSELQDMVMSIRMVPLTSTFQKMHRIVRDMNKKLNKEVQLEVIGEETEVDKNIIEHISDPIMHLVRNAMDHGIEATDERKAKGKSKSGTITLEAKNAGNDVVIFIKDNGKGLNKAKILEKARQNDLLYKPETEMADKEIFNLIFLPGFSTKDAVSEFSGRGVGMDVVIKNIEKVGGSVSIESAMGQGTTIILKIPLTLAIVDGMNIGVGKSCYTIPTIAIKQSFRPKLTDIITDPDNNEMIMVRGECYPIIRLHELYKVKSARELFNEGILIMVEDAEKTVCLFADELLGEQQVVVKPLPALIKNIKEIKGLSGCTLLGDGSISLILDTRELISGLKA